MGNVLPATDDPVSGERKPEENDLAAKVKKEREFYDRRHSPESIERKARQQGRGAYLASLIDGEKKAGYDKAEEKRKGWNEKRALKNPKGKDGKFIARYKYKRKWTDRTPNVPQAELERRMLADRVLVRLQTKLMLPSEERLREMRDDYHKEHIAPLIAEAQALQLEIEPVAEKLCQLDGKMRKVLSAIRSFHHRMMQFKVTPDEEIRKKLAARVDYIWGTCANQVAAGEQLRMRKEQGFWNYQSKKIVKTYGRHYSKEARLAASRAEEAIRKAAEAKSSETIEQKEKPT